MRVGTTPPLRCSRASSAPGIPHVIARGRALRGPRVDGTGRVSRPGSCPLVLSAGRCPTAGLNSFGGPADDLPRAMDSDVTEGRFPTQDPEGWPAQNAASHHGDSVTGGTDVDPAASATAPLPVDAVVSTMAQLIFVTTGQVACDEFDEFPTQVAFTPRVARRVAEVLRFTLQYPDLVTRQAIVAQWQAEEDPHVPHGRLLMDESAIRFGIEPIGAGALIVVGWAHVPALIYQLEAATAQIG